MNIKNILAFLRHIFLCLTIAVMGVADAGAEEISENKIKSVFIYKLSKYIRWDELDKIPLVCFYGERKVRDNSVAWNLDELIGNKDNEVLKVKEIRSIRNIKNCDMVFVGFDGEDVLNDIFSIVNGDPIVTISEITGFARRGGMFEFVYDENDKIKIQLNYNNSKRQKVKINAALLEMIKIVK